MKRRNGKKQVFITYSYKTNNGETGVGYVSFNLARKHIVTKKDLIDAGKIIKKSQNVKEVVIQDYKLMQ